MSSLDIKTILANLAPSYPDPLHGWWLYIIFILLGVTMVMQKAGSSMMITFLLGGAMLFALIEKIQGFEKSNALFLAYAGVMLMAVFPLVVVGMTRSPKSRLPAGLATLFSLVYLLVFWVQHSF